MYGVLFVGDAKEPAALCESYRNGMIYEVHSTLRAAQRYVAQSLEPRYPGSYRPVALPGYAGPETVFCDPEYSYPQPEGWHQGDTDI